VTTPRQGDRGRRKAALVAIAGILSGLIFIVTMSAGDASNSAPEQAGLPNNAGARPPKRDESLRTLIRSGYTRPGNPSDDTDPDGTIKPIAWQEVKGRILGGTVYFAVYDRYGGRDRPEEAYGAGPGPGAGGDTWRTGLADLDDRFVPGRSRTRSGVSPRLDTRARYLYLYQIVNDRGTVMPGEKGMIVTALAGAAEQAVKTQDVASFTVKLGADPQAITSWGHFRAAGFAATVPDLALQQDRQGGIRFATADGGLPGKDLRLAISADPNIQNELPVQRYLRFSPVYALGRLSRDFATAEGTLGMRASSTHRALAKNKANGIVLASWAEHLLTAADTARAPAYVQVKFFPLPPMEAGAGAEGPGALEGPSPFQDEPAPAHFRVDWDKGRYLEGGVQSTAFGFTTNVPPGELPLRLDDPEAARASEGIRTVASAQPGQAPGVGISARSPSMPGNAPGAGGMNAPGGFSSGGFPGGGAGGIGSAGVPLVVGGGGSSSSGSSKGSTAAQTSQNNTATSSNNPVVNVTVNAQPTINFNAALLNHQAQAQEQGQVQTQSQSLSQAQAQGQDPPAGADPSGWADPSSAGAVVPAPTSLLLGVLGLPGLLWLRLRTPLGRRGR
jgi:hypothetical protein